VIEIRVKFNQAGGEMKGLKPWTTN